MTIIRRARIRFSRSQRPFPTQTAAARARAADRTLLAALERRDGEADRIIDRLLTAIERTPNARAR